VKILTLLISIFVASQGILFGQAKELLPYEDAAAYEVYSAVLSIPQTQGPRISKNFVIRQETLRNFGAYWDTDPKFGICLRPDPEWEKVIGPAIADYLRVNKTKWRLQEKIKVERPFQLVSSDIILGLVKKESWEGFYKKYPDSGGFIDLSAVGFNEDKSVAVLSKGGWCGDLCGGGEYYVLQKRDGKWVPLDWKGEKCSWISWIKPNDSHAA
jgi:hypothetical protein